MPLHAATVEQILQRRQQRQIYPGSPKRWESARTTVAQILKRKGLSRLAVLSPARPDNRYEHDAPRGFLHLDIKKLGRFEWPGNRVTGDHQQNTAGAGWEYVHVAIDDHSRLAYAFTRMRRVGALAWPCSGPCAITPAWASALTGCSPITAPARLLSVPPLPAPVPAVKSETPPNPTV